MSAWSRGTVYAPCCSCTMPGEVFCQPYQSQRCSGWHIPLALAEARDDIAERQQASVDVCCTRVNHMYSVRHRLSVNTST